MKMGLITKKFHNKFVYSRRMLRLAELLIPLITKSEKILDVGCGDGKIDDYLLKRNSNISIKGIDVLVRSKTYIEVAKYDGKIIPYGNKTFDTVMIIDVLHHIDNPNGMMAELARVSSKYVIVKDHVKSGVLSYLKLRVMDYVGNTHYHVRLPYNYQTKEQWKTIFKNNNLKVIKIYRHLNLYTGLFHLLFDCNLHFIAVLEKECL